MTIRTDRDNYPERLEEILINENNDGLRLSAGTVRELGMSGTRVGRWFGLSQPAASRSVAQREKPAQDMKLSFVS